MEDDLIERARKGEPEAVGELYQRHSSRVYSVVRRLVGEDAQAEDLAQEAWIRVFRALPTFRGDARFSTWVHRIAVNTALHGRRSGKRREAVVFAVEHVPEISARAESPLLRLDLERALERLPEGMRRILVLHDVEGFKHDEIADMLGVAVGTCKSQLFKARAKLREMLQPEPAEIEGAEIWTT